MTAMCHRYHHGRRCSSCSYSGHCKLNIYSTGRPHQTNHGETDVSGCVVASGRARGQRRLGTLAEDTASCSDSATRAACVKRQSVHGVRLGLSGLSMRVGEGGKTNLSMERNRSGRSLTTIYTTNTVGCQSGAWNSRNGSPSHSHLQHSK